jgi:AcrR family transcriptional regulator
MDNHKGHIDKFCYFVNAARRMNKQTMTAVAGPITEDARRARILEGATTVFLAYGFQRTTMDDIAKAAEISRPALYLVFRNKSDIYRALAAEFLAKTLESSREALTRDGPIGTRLEQSLFCTIDMAAEIGQAPHGAEILDMKNSLAGDIVADGNARQAALFEAAITQEATDRGVDLGKAGLNAGTLATLLLDAFEGMKQRGLPVQSQREAVRRYVAVVTGALGA